jgi:hypothetical protein
MRPEMSDMLQLRLGRDLYPFGFRTTFPTVQITVPAPQDRGYIIRRDSWVPRGCGLGDVEVHVHMMFIVDCLNKLQRRYTDSLSEEACHDMMSGD